MEKQYDVVIIGGGPAGYAAGMYCARSGFSALVLEKLGAGGQMATTSQVDNYPGFDQGIDGLELAQKMQAGAERFGVTSEFAEVTSLALTGREKQIQTTSGEVRARAVVLAMGALPRKLGVPEEEALVGRGVGYCATCDGMFYKDKVVTVIGGGNSAAEEAMTLVKLCKKVYLIHRRDKLRAEHIYLKTLEQADNLEFIWDTQVEAFLHEEKLTGLRLKHLKTGEKSDLPCAGVFIAVGRVPNTQLVKGQLALDEHGYIQADESTQTSLPGVFAAGDIRVKALRQIVTAAADGAVASRFVGEYLGMDD